MVSQSCYVEKGDRVKVRFANKEYIGVISDVGITPDIDSRKILPITSVVHDLEKVNHYEIELWKKIAEYYLCTTGEVYKAAYPATKTTLEEARAVHTKTKLERRARLIKSMEERIRRIEDRLVKKEKQIADAKDGTKKRRQLEEGAAKTRIELSSALEAYNKITSGDDESDNIGQYQAHTDISLSLAQETAFRQIHEGFTTNKPILLHGITGSGKTEIYIKLAQEVLSKGLSVLYMVPEIALSRQLEERLEEHFGNRLLVFHSGETGVSKINTAEAIRNTSTGYIVLGTRSSLFLPHHNLGLIIVDEEHDSSYKQDSPAPRYNGRDAALMLSTIHQCNIILGSATPSFEEIYNCQFGRHIKISLNERFHGASDSEIQIIDTRAERRKNGMVGSFSRKLIEAVRKAIAQGQQVMLLRSRRAWAPILQCENCGEIVKCPHCNVSMTLHKNVSGEFMVCHYCGHKAAYNGTCSKCSGTLKGIGAGTQKIEQEAAMLFPTARIARLDSDTYSDKKQEGSLIKDFAAGRIDILIGTQMLAKGFDFSNLSLVAVIAADTLLGMQDFRADEKALQLMEQFRGRCGRREDKGTFIIQTSQPEHPVYSRLNMDATTASNLEDMLQERHDLNYPPYSRIIEITFRDIYEDRVVRKASKLAGLLKHHFAKDESRISFLGSNLVTGPYAPVVDKIADQHIRTIRISLKKDRALRSHKNALREIITVFEKSEKYIGHIAIDVDPT